MRIEAKTSKIGNKDKPSMYVIIPHNIRKELNLEFGEVVEIEIAKKEVKTENEQTK
jgi:antitoxin component of MazEF toxin-antitoxin module